MDAEKGLDRNGIILIVASFVVLVGGVLFVSSKNSSTNASKDAINQVLGQKTGKSDNIPTPDLSVTPLPTSTPTPTAMPMETTKLGIEDLTVGAGAEATNSAQVTVNYIGTLSNGQKFDSSYDHNQPFSFQLGTGQVIKGWDMGVLGMKVGGKRRLTVPPSLGYGDRAVGQIPPNSILIFDVELLDVK